MNLEKLCEQTSNQLMLHSHTSISQTHIHSLIKCAHLSRNRAQSTAFNDFFPSHQFDFLFTLKSKRYTRFSGLTYFVASFFYSQKLQILLALARLLLFSLLEEISSGS